MNSMTFAKTFSNDALKKQKELEVKLHTQLYDNIRLLSFTHPVSSNLAKVLKKDMFVKNNKAAFQEVTYYLLKVLDPERIKQKVTAWPIYDSSSERDFRHQVMQYINKLNSLYDGANITNITTSHLIAPGGFRFVKFMLKISQLVLYETMKRDLDFRDSLLYKIVPSKNFDLTEKAIETMIQKAATVNEHTEKLQHNFLKELEEFKAHAEDITRTLVRTTVDIQKNTVRYNDLKKNYLEDVKSDTKKTLDELKEKLNVLKEVLLKAKHFEYSIVQLEIRERVLLNKNKQEKACLDLIGLVKYFNKIFENKIFDFVSSNDSDVNENLLTFSTAKEELEHILVKYKDSFHDLEDLCRCLTFEKINNDSVNNNTLALTPDSLTMVAANVTYSPLAVPLENSDEN